MLGRERSSPSPPPPIPIGAGSGPETGRLGEGTSFIVASVTLTPMSPTSYWPVTGRPDDFWPMILTDGKPIWEKSGEALGVIFRLRYIIRGMVNRWKLANF